jgi:nicotinate-nucleotide adenylyltransferase
MRIGILGGAFNPITVAHIQIAKFVLDNTNVSKIWIMPNVQDPLGKKKLARYDDRLNMVRLAVDNADSRIDWSTYERDKNLTGKTWQTLQSLHWSKKYKGVTFYWIIGLDQAKVFHLWESSSWLMRLGNFIVVPRKGIQPWYPTPDGEWYQQPNHIDLTDVKSKIKNVSSTHVRQALGTGKGARQLKEWLHPSVLAYIRTNRLYQRSKT